MMRDEHNHSEMFNDDERCSREMITSNRSEINQIQRTDISKAHC